MSFYKKSCLMVIAILLGFSLAGCEKKAGEGPAERAGKEVDKAMEQAGQAIDKAKEAVKETAKDASEKLTGATKDK
jgi:uncharacterized lipoprotein YehR (DUF1307 family)